ncbi:MAG TPA: primosomal protein N' [Candidatus Cloacimonadota bacterium]|nr:primosomal protein N' [Candidatus Cloacimonadota bacterium]
MRYITVHLPLGIDKEFVYRTETSLVEGLRVVVVFNRKLILGVTGKMVEKPPSPGIRYQSIEEVLDTAPLFEPKLLELAVWMAGYYLCGVGKVLFAMLPSLLQPDLDTQIRWQGEGEVPEALLPLYNLISDGDYHILADLHKQGKKLSVYRLAELAEAEGRLEVRRKLSHKDKPRTVNYIRLIDAEVDRTKLPPKQLEVFEILLAGGGELPMSDLANQVSYSPIKTLVKKGIMEIISRKISPSDSISFTASALREISLTEEQRSAITAISEGFGAFNTNLLFGITGSGKTEVYVEIIKKYLAVGKTVIFLIPEIALTPQMVDRFSGAFGEILAIQHSQLTERDRLDQWQRIRSGKCRIVIGARSAVFAPLPGLGLIIVDEEHEQSYKQDNHPRYHGRDVAIMRANLEGAQVILGSATPSLESWNNARIGKYRQQSLYQRPLSYELPEVKILNLCEEQDTELLSSTLLAAINDRLEKHEQVILFQNRRGFSSYMQCLKCGELITCPACEISMYYHRDREEMHCHYCGYHIPSPRKCPKCGSFSFSYGSPGTQKVEQNLRVIFPDARIMRMDSDTAKARDTYRSMYERMKNQEVDILLGTQMISKGLDFPGVTLVGIINADISLNVPDFRSAERTFQLVTQVAGRSGRGDKHGEVIIQTHNPDHYAITHATHQDFPGFAEEELSYRNRLHYPPYYRLARILYQSKDQELIKSNMDALEALLDHIRHGFSADELIFLGPTPAPFSKMNGLYRYHLILKGLNTGVISKTIKTLNAAFKLAAGISSSVDIDPVSLM